MNIRIANHDDIPLIASIIRESYQTVADRFQLNIKNCPKHPSNCTDKWISHDFNRGLNYYLLESEGNIMGCAAIEIASSELCYLERLAVLPPNRNKGFGDKLVSHVIGEAKCAGYKKVSIGIIAEQTDLKNWYQKFGFVEGDTKQFEHLPFQVTFMEYENAS